LKSYNGVESNVYLKLSYIIVLMSYVDEMIYKH